MSHPLSSFSGIVRENEPLAPYTWLQIGGPTKYLVEPNTVEELGKVVGVCHEAGISVRVLGGGSNLLVRESGFSGATFLLSAPTFQSVRRTGNSITCGAGAKLSHVVTFAVGEGLGGLEHLIAIPGTVGGALRGNAGSHDGEVAQYVSSATILTKDGVVRRVDPSELAFTHRASGVDGVAIVDVTFDLVPGDSKALTKRQQTFWILKRRLQPSFPERAAIAFVDPVGFEAAELIQQAGLSGSSEGAVRMSSMFPNFLIASTGATSVQVQVLLDRVKAGVQDRSGVQLQQHLQIW